MIKAGDHVVVDRVTRTLGNVPRRVRRGTAGRVVTCNNAVCLVDIDPAPGLLGWLRRLVFMDYAGQAIPIHEDDLYVTVAAADIPVAPVNHVVADPMGTKRLTWSPVPNVTGYRVYMSLAGPVIPASSGVVPSTTYMLVPASVHHVSLSQFPDLDSVETAQLGVTAVGHDGQESDLVTVTYNRPVQVDVAGTAFHFPMTGTWTPAGYSEGLPVALLPMQGVQGVMPPMVGFQGPPPIKEGDLVRLRGVPNSHTWRIERIFPWHDGLTLSSACANYAVAHGDQFSVAYGQGYAAPVPTLERAFLHHEPAPEPVVDNNEAMTHELVAVGDGQWRLTRVPPPAKLGLLGQRPIFDESHDD